MTHSGDGLVKADLNARAGLRVLALCRDELVLLGVRAVLGRQDWVSRCLVASDPSQALELTRRHLPHLALVHVGPADNAAGAVAELQSGRPGMSVVLIAEAGRFSEADARTVGASAVMATPLAASQLVAVTRSVATGKRPRVEPTAQSSALSERERQVLSHIATGATNREIGVQLVLAPDTIKNHVSRAYRKLGARNRLEAVNRARDLGLIA